MISNIHYKDYLYSKLLTMYIGEERDQPKVEIWQEKSWTTNLRILILEIQDKIPQNFPVWCSRLDMTRSNLVKVFGEILEFVYDVFSQIQNYLQENKEKFWLILIYNVTSFTSKYDLKKLNNLWLHSCNIIEHYFVVITKNG